MLQVDQLPWSPCAGYSLPLVGLSHVTVKKQGVVSFKVRSLNMKIFGAWLKILKATHKTRFPKSEEVFRLAPQFPKIL